MPRKILYIYIALALLYVALTFLTPLDPRLIDRYEIGEIRLNLIRLSIAIPLLGIWFAAFYGYSKFKAYADLIKESKDGRAFTHIANGLGLLALSLPLRSILSVAFRSLTQQSPDLLPLATIISNYITLLFTLGAFLLIFRGSQHLTAIVKTEGKLHSYALAGFGILAIFYTYLALTNPARMVATDNVDKAVYFLPDPLILLTIVLPYVFIWFIGLKTFVNLQAYQTHSDGVVYKRILTYLTRGVATVIIMSIVLQFLRELVSPLSQLSLGPLLGIVYLLLIGMAVGYLYIAAGAKRLQKIEEV